MQRVLITLLFLLGIAVSSVASAQESSWWQADWKYRKPLTLDLAAAKLGTDAGRATVLVRLHSGNFSFDGVAPNGADLRVVASDGRTVLNHQIEQFDAALGIATLWVDVPALRTGTPQTVWLYYGNANAPAAASAQLAFDPDYVGVYHFAETEGAPRDTTAYNNHARNAVARVDDGVIGRAANLKGEPLVIPAAPSLAVTQGGALTFSAWLRPDQLGPNQVVYARRDGSNAVLVGLDNGVPFVSVNGARANGQQAVSAGQRLNVALSAGSGQVVLYVDGNEVARLEAALPALNSDILIGGDAPPAIAGDTSPQVAATAFTGMIDEVRLSKVARSAGLIQADVAGQMADSKLVAFGADEQSEGVSHFGFILKAMPVDAWVVVAVLFVMLLASWAIMLAKGRYFGAVEKANASFTDHYRNAAGQPITRLGELASAGQVGQLVQEKSTLWRLYRIALNEVKGRQAHTGNARLSDAAIGAIRATLDAEVTRESERMAKRMNWLSTTIEGAPYVGLFGTVIGIMLVFAVAAMAGAVDINSVAPGMAAALLCTAAGLGVAIPALFGYNWLSARADAIGADMSIFVDEFSARLAEESEDGKLALAAAARG